MGPTKECSPGKYVSSERAKDSIKKDRGIFGRTGAKTESEWMILLDCISWGRADNFARTPKEVTARLDSLIKEIHAIQGPYMHGEKDCNVILVAHGHILRAFVKRWLKYPLDMPLSLMLEPGGIGILR